MRDLLPPYKPEASVERAAIPAVYAWNLAALFPSDDAWEASRRALQEEIPTLDVCGTLKEPRVLKSCLERYFRLHDEVNRVTLYANLQRATAETDPAVGARAQASLSLLSDLMDRATLLRKGLFALTDKQVDKAFGRDASLAPYRAYVDNLRRRAGRTLSGDGERVLSLMGDNLWAEIDLNEIPSHAEEAFLALRADLPWPMARLSDGREIRVTVSNYNLLRRSPSRVDRETVTRAFLGALATYQHVFAAALGGQASFDVALARARGYATARHAYLDKDELDVAVHDQLLATVRARLPALHRYMELRRRVLGVEKLSPWDLTVPIAGDALREVPFATARADILSALEPLGPAYLAVASEALDPSRGWMDLYPHRGKQSGAFSASVYGSHPYIFMNYQDLPSDRSTLAHELGHALHSHLTARRQPYANFRYTSFIGEIASTTNEVLLFDALLARATERAERAALISEHLDTIRNTIFRQALFADFELRLHAAVEAGTPVTAELLRRDYQALLLEWYGPAFAAEGDADMEWAYVPHFYWKFYVANYATGLSSAIALAERIRTGPAARDAYLAMLEGGCSRPPLDLLKTAGVDLTRPDAVQAALDRFERLLVELEGLL
jgi:oligoendopeptidase F